MRSNRQMRWLLMGVMGVGVTAGIPSFSHAADRTRTATATPANDDVETKIDKVPKEARATIDRESEGGKLQAVYFVHRDGREFYRAMVQIKHTERAIRVGAEGRLLSIVDRPEGNKEEHWYKQVEDRQLARDARLAKEHEVITATPKNPEKVNWDQVPAPVRTTFIREAAGDKPDYIVRYRENDNVLYQTNIADGPGKVHMIQVTPDGRVFSEGEFTSRGSAVAEDHRIRSLEYSELPRGIRAVVDKEAPKGRVNHVSVADRRGHKIYTVEVDEGRTDRYLTIFDDGRLLSDITEKE